jgi:hypothetical protein
MFIQMSALATAGTQACDTPCRFSSPRSTPRCRPRLLAPRQPPALPGWRLHKRGADYKENWQTIEASRGCTASRAASCAATRNSPRQGGCVGFRHPPKQAGVDTKGPAHHPHPLGPKPFLYVGCGIEQTVSRRGCGVRCGVCAPLGVVGGSGSDPRPPPPPPPPSLHAQSTGPPPALAGERRGNMTENIVTKARQRTVTLDQHLQQLEQQGGAGFLC